MGNSDHFLAKNNIIILLYLRSGVKYVHEFLKKEKEYKISLDLPPEKRYIVETERKNR